MKNILKYSFVCFILSNCAPYKNCDAELHLLKETTRIDDIQYNNKWRLIELSQGRTEYFKDEKYCLKTGKEQELKDFIKQNYLPLNHPDIRKDSLLISNIFGEDNGLDRFLYMGWLILNNKQDTIYCTSSFDLWKINKDLFVLHKTKDFKKLFKKER